MSTSRPRRRRRWCPAIIAAAPLLAAMLILSPAAVSMAAARATSSASPLTATAVALASAALPLPPSFAMGFDAEDGPSSDDDDMEDSSDDDEDRGGPGGNKHCLVRNPNGSCRTWSFVQHFYNDFGEVEIRWASCDEMYEDIPDEFEEVAVEESLYQKIVFEENIKRGDKCLYLDTTMQQCSSYRPQYHEPFVHFSASYLNRGKTSGLRRVVFVGGGDSMLLHEILKYDSLELVLGLELDQKVTRDSFETFKTQPHFDDPRVQWWFGDGAKSLTLLPREYFGTFDLVLLDLSETVMSMTVTKGLDVFGAMKLLLSPTGILVKNDFGYFEQLSKVFDTCMQLLIPAVYICDFELVLCGSDKVDFLDPSFVHMKGAADGQVETLMYKPHVYLDDHWGPMTDFSKYWGEPRQCLDGDAPVDEEAIAHAGILMIVEAENVSTQLNDVAEAAETFEGILRSLGYNVLKSTTSYAGPEEGATFVVAMEEGYVLADTWPDSKYCKLDIHLWGKFERQEDIRTGLLEALGSKDGDWQSYRIVTGGMHGCATRKEDLKRTGPDLAKIGQCEPEEEGSRRSIVPNSSYADEPALGPVIDAGLTHIIPAMTTGDVRDFNAVVFCGAKDQPCRAKSNLEKQGFANLMTLWSCPEEKMKEFATNPQLRGEAIAKWRQTLNNKTLSDLSLCGIGDVWALHDVAKRTRGFNVVVVDALSPSSHVIGSQEYWQKYRDPLRDLFLVLVPILDPKDDSRTAFLRSRFNRAVDEPEFYSEMLVGYGSKVMSFGLIHRGNSESLQGLTRAGVQLDQADAVEFTDIRRVTIRGAMRQQKDFDPVLYSWDDYDQRPGLEQLYGQKSVGFQTVFQLNLGADADTKLSAEVLKKSFKGALGKSTYDTVKAIHEVGDGLLLVAFTSEGQVAVTWDGGDEINVNIYTDDEDADHNQVFLLPFTNLLPTTAIVLKDEQPRGYGKVVTKSERVNVDESPDCYDHYRMCKTFAGDNLCSGDDVGKGAREWMGKHCRVSCMFCNRENENIVEGSQNNPQDFSNNVTGEKDCIKYHNDGSCHLYSNVQHFHNDFGEIEVKWASCNLMYEDLQEDFDVVAKESSLYQKIMFEENLIVGDKCLYLDTTMQQCSSYRPHYHEPFVHFSASYLNRGKTSGLRRVVFVGGGDSMLLHEILKYDSLELVLGLELDQKVTRDSFETFKTQPHFDDPRVQWWFGDGAKSLTLLPREYFGTFDLVLLDLSETVMSMTVTKGLDVFGAMKLLLSPTGVLVKNDFGYFEQLSKVFDTCMQIDIPGVTYICDFELVLCGSDKVDFLDPSFVHMKGAADGQVDSLLYKPQENVDDHWGPVTDFSKYWGEPRQCLERDAPVDEEAIAHAGILMIVEAENVSTELNDVAEAAETFEGILKSLGYNVLKRTQGSPGTEGRTSLFLALEEGYVLADTWPDSKYCKLDIHLWGKFERQEDIRTGLLEALGSKDGDWQSYRIVTGGMHGCATRKEDLKRTGPDLAKIGQCEPEEEGSRRSIVPNSSYADEPALGPVIDAGLTDIIAMMIGEKISVLNAVVFCGAKDQPCRAKSNMEKQGFANLMTLWSCSDKEKTEVEASPHLLDQALAQFQYFLDHESIEEFTVCGIKSDAVLLRLTKKIGSISVLVVDALAPSLYVQGSQEYLDKNTKYITKPSLLLVPILDDADNARVSFLRSRYNRGKVEPEYYSEMLVGDGNKVMSFGMIHEGNADSIQGLIHAQDRLNQEGAVKFTDIRRVTIRGAIRKQNDFDPVLFSWNDYDQRPGLEQFYSQKAVGFQTVFQLKEELGAEADMMSRGEVERAFKSAVRRIWQNADDIVEAVNEVGDGLLLAALSSGGQVVMTWDGADGINVNIFTYAEDVDHHQSFVSPLTDSLTPMSLILQDEQPRGHNKVMTKSDRVDHDESPDCYDHYRMCEVFSENGACTKGDNTKEWTKKHCKFSCKHCDKESLTAKSEL